MRKGIIKRIKKTNHAKESETNYGSRLLEFSSNGLGQMLFTLCSGLRLLKTTSAFNFLH